MHIELTPTEIKLLREAGIPFSVYRNYRDAALLRLLDRIYRVEADWARQLNSSDALTQFRAYAALADKILQQYQHHIENPQNISDTLVQQLNALQNRVIRLEQQFHTEYISFQIWDFWCFMPGSSFVFRIYPWFHGNAVILEFAESPIAAEHYDFTDRAVFYLGKMNEEEMFQAIIRKVAEHDETSFRRIPSTSD